MKLIAQLEVTWHGSVIGTNNVTSVKRITVTLPASHHLTQALINQSTAELCYGKISTFQRCYFDLRCCYDSCQSTGSYMLSRTTNQKDNNKKPISYHIISYHIISYHIISYHIISYHIIIVTFCRPGEDT